MGSFSGFATGLVGNYTTCNLFVGIVRKLVIIGEIVQNVDYTVTKLKVE